MGGVTAIAPGGVAPSGSASRWLGASFGWLTDRTATTMPAAAPSAIPPMITERSHRRRLFGAAMPPAGATGPGAGVLDCGATGPGAGVLGSGAGELTGLGFLAPAGNIARNEAARSPANAAAGPVAPAGVSGPVEGPDPRGCALPVVPTATNAPHRKIKYGRFGGTLHVADCRHSAKIRKGSRRPRRGAQREPTSVALMRSSPCFALQRTFGPKRRVVAPTLGTCPQGRLRGSLHRGRNATKSYRFVPMRPGRRGSGRPPRRALINTITWKMAPQLAAWAPFR